MLRPFCLVLLLASCGPAPGLYLVTPPPAAEEVRVRVGTIEVIDISLPAYAAASDIVVEAADGSLATTKNALWADDPVRGMTYALTEQLDRQSNATAAAEPWPLTEPADVQIEVRVDRLVARADMSLVLSGQYAVASRDGVISEFVDRFAIAIPLPATDPATVGRAQGAAIDALAQQIIARLR
jgi:uncharacterized lipoprotein YmbA